MTEVEKLQKRIDKMKENGMSDFKASPGNIEGATEEDIARELNQMLDAFESGQGRPLKFNDRDIMKK